ncbi:hypothetical protein A9Q89_04555 [Gammaproteobacteria bacterium 53_120_T64]|nr:hypothetical protein A9Q89_04555 [Gammaproteobacteria bacterium 53_120_T64]
MGDSKEIPSKFYHESEGESYVNLDAYLNEQGSITIYIKDGASIDMSPLAAKELIVRLNAASKEFASELFSSK